ncbi:carbohydrate ABC transporter membrane protein 1 (CUT1 family) [Scopulibacillus darangshiensis]|uniref:Carbohydrate ABC transporter membrane protein 1 (CUT1 family) n=1 Tax=Scopulibacillus darangshiensis TaxID=442528 RepID=A0A4R2P4E6_9BACL|nr:sugar ABC transporter permease [Scopulibacillus darangshiensis]TCP29613.1 carbohydrate ABC transporter membrane protein 1 (CUT1 family) [Scopulibacillus darangshiensis]
MQLPLEKNNKKVVQTKAADINRRKRWITPKSAPYIFIAPTVILLIIFTLYPIVSSFLLSFKTKIAGQYVFSGFHNYIRLFHDPVFYKSLVNTFEILIIQVPIMIFLALIIAVLINSPIVKLNALFRISFFMPAITSLVAASLVFMILLDNNTGLVNYLLSLMGIHKIAWLTQPFWAKVSIIILMSWRWIGYNMVIFLAGLQGIGQDLYEAASIDGAGKVRQFFSITLPQLKPIFVFTVVLSTIGTLQLFDEPYILTGGGPSNATMTITLYLYQNGFKYFDFGYASAIAYVLVIITAILSWIQLKWAGDKD